MNMHKQLQHFNAMSTTFMTTVH